MVPPAQQTQPQQHQQAPPDAFIYRRGAAGGGLRAFPQLWQQRKRGTVVASSATAATSLASLASAAAAASNPTPLTEFHVPEFIACPEAFLEVRNGWREEDE